jgi:hypothetical protein
MLDMLKDKMYTCTCMYTPPSRVFVMKPRIDLEMKISGNASYSTNHSTKENLELVIHIYRLWIFYIDISK